MPIIWIYYKIPLVLGVLLPLEVLNFWFVNIYIPKAGISYRNFTLNAGVENLFDKKYYEHFSYVRNPLSTGVKVPEPGRSFYVSASYQF